MRNKILLQIPIAITAAICLQQACSIRAGRPGRISDRQSTQLILDATDLASAFEKSELQAAQLYEGKRARISGYFARSESLPDGRASMVLKTSLDTYRPIRCVIERSQLTGIGGAASGDAVTIIGVIKGFTDSGYFISVDDCSVELPQ